MPLYYFDTIESQKTLIDDIGIECQDYAEIRALTLRTICEIAAQTCLAAEPPHYEIIVRDADNRKVYAARLNLVEQTKLAA